MDARGGDRRHGTNIGTACALVTARSRYVLIERSTRMNVIHPKKLSMMFVRKWFPLFGIMP